MSWLEKQSMEERSSLKEVKEIVKLAEFNATSSSNSSETNLDCAVVEQLRSYVHTISLTYNENPFHNFQVRLR